MRSYCWLSGEYGNQSILIQLLLFLTNSITVVLNQEFSHSTLQVQPLVGLYSDRCTARWGRRRPFILTGCILICLAVRTSEPHSLSFPRSWNCNLVTVAPCFLSLKFPINVFLFMLYRSLLLAFRQTSELL